jgi:hypothetical protein
VLLDGEWRLRDLYEFPHALGQCYAFIYCFDSDLRPRERERIDEAVVKFLSDPKNDREEAKLEQLRLTEAQVAVVITLSEDLARFLGFKSLAELHARTGGPEVSLRLLAAHYRRMSVLVDFVHEGQAALPSEKRP